MIASRDALSDNPDLPGGNPVGPITPRGLDADLADRGLKERNLAQDVAVTRFEHLPGEAGIVLGPPVPRGLVSAAAYGVEDLLTGKRYTWGENNYVRLDTQLPAHVLYVVK